MRLGSQGDYLMVGIGATGTVHLSLSAHPLLSITNTPKFYFFPEILHPLSPMASTKTSINVQDIPCFNGHAYQQWVDKMHGIFLITNTTSVINGTLVTNAASTEPNEPTQPPPAG